MEPVAFQEELMNYREAMAEAEIESPLRFDECNDYWWSDVRSENAFGVKYVSALLTCMRTGEDRRFFVAIQTGDKISPMRHQRA